MTKPPKNDQQYLWGRLMRAHRIERDMTVPCEGGLDIVQEAVTKICHQLDIPRPIWMAKHENDILEYGRTVFRADDFMESVAFDRFEIELYGQSASKGHARDPRNEA